MFRTSRCNFKGMADRLTERSISNIPSSTRGGPAHHTHGLPPRNVCRAQGFTHVHLDTRSSVESPWLLLYCRWLGTSSLKTSHPMTFVVSDFQNPIPFIFVCFVLYKELRNECFFEFCLRYFFTCSLNNLSFGFHPMILITVFF